ncbi:MAG: B12-binding domain-containing radical SAM protein [Melioribacter sp.]|nr:B12-binding domain-containing radical SAM protein [Melioribacter sp.]
MNKIILFNPRSANSKPRIPNSILSVAASVEGKFDYLIVDGNLEKDPLKKIISAFQTGEYKYFGITVMPGPQLKQAIPISREIKRKFNNVIIIWGGYFPSNQPEVVLSSGYVDFIINGPGDFAFPKLIDALEEKRDPNFINNLIYLNRDEIKITAKDELYDQDALPVLPYSKLNNFYPLRYYLGKTFLGTKTIAYHSSVGCPFLCSFCGIVPIYNARWKGRSAQKIYDDIKLLKDVYDGNAIEFHDNNFFVSEKRTVEFSELIKNEKMIWWGEGRIDTVNNFKDSSLELMREAGCRMIFFGAESGSDEMLKQMNKGGTQTKEQIKQFAARMKKFDIIPEYSFVLGFPGGSEKSVMNQIDSDINFIREIKRINPDTEVIIYIYSPVPTLDSELFKQASNKGFKFPEKLEDWINPHWEKFDLRKNPLTPWLNKSMVNRIKNFETVLNGYYPTVSDIKLSELQRKIIKLVSVIRYKTKIYTIPYEIKFLQRYWLRYRQPEIEGFYVE